MTGLHYPSQRIPGRSQLTELGYTGELADRLEEVIVSGAPTAAMLASARITLGVKVVPRGLQALIVTRAQYDW